MAECNITSRSSSSVIGSILLNKFFFHFFAVASSGRIKNRLKGIVVLSMKVKKQQTQKIRTMSHFFILSLCPFLYFHLVFAFLQYFFCCTLFFIFRFSYFFLYFGMSRLLYFFLRQKSHLLLLSFSFTVCTYIFYPKNRFLRSSSSSLYMLFFSVEQMGKNEKVSYPVSFEFNPLLFFFLYVCILCIYFSL